MFGVLSALEVVRTLNDHDIETAAPIEIVNWDERGRGGALPPPCCLRRVRRAFRPGFCADRTDVDGLRFGDELERIGYAGDAPIGEHPFAAFFEAHIEQGPILEREGLPVGAVATAQGFRWYDIAFEGQAAHTGSTPMEGRHNALLGAARVITAVDQIALDHGPDGRGTVGGQFQVSPGSRNIIPGRVDFTVDLRHPDAASLASMSQALSQHCRDAAEDIGLTLSFEEISYTPPVIFDDGCVNAVETACKTLNYPYRRMISGAGHEPATSPRSRQQP